MAAGLESFSGVAADCCFAQCNFIRCCHQCWWEVPAMAAGIGTFDGDAADRCSAQRHFLQAAISACEKGLQWQQALGLLTVMQMTAVPHNVIYYKPPSVLVRRACSGRRLWVFWRGCSRLLLFAVISSTAAIRACEKCLLSFSTMPPSVLVKRASNGSRPWVV